MRTAGEGHYYFDERQKLFCWRLIAGGRPVVRKAKTQALLKAKVKLALADVDTRGGAVPRLAQSMTVGQYLDYWLAEVIHPPNRAKTTHRSYSQICRLYIKPHVGSLPLLSLSATQCQSLLNKVSKQVSSPETVGIVHRTFRSALSWATRARLLAANPILAAEIPKRASATILGRQKRALPPSQVPAILEEMLRTRVLKTRDETVHVHRYGPMLAFALATGLRLSELLGALRTDIFEMAELEGAFVIHVQRTLLWEGKDWSIDHDVKRPKSNRIIPLSGLALACIRARDAMVERDAQLAGGHREEHGLLWTTETGRPVKERNLQRALDSILAELKIPHVSLKDLRKSFGSLLARKNTPISTLQDLMGHESFQTTRKHYVLVFGGDMLTAVNSIGYELAP